MVDGVKGGREVKKTKRPFDGHTQMMSAEMQTRQIDIRQQDAVETVDFAPGAATWRT